MDNVKVIEDSESSKIRDISFEEENIGNHPVVTTSVISSGMITILYIMKVAHSVRVVNQDIPMSCSI